MAFQVDFQMTFLVRACKSNLLGLSTACHTSQMYRRSLVRIGSCACPRPACRSRRHVYKVSVIRRWQQAYDERNHCAEVKSLRCQKCCEKFLTPKRLERLTFGFGIRYSTTELRSHMAHTQPDDHIYKWSAAASVLILPFIPSVIGSFFPLQQ